MEILHLFFNKKISTPVWIFIILLFTLLSEGFLIWQCKIASRCEILPIKSLLGPENQLTITTNKIEYEEGEMVKIAVKNNLDKSVWYKSYDPSSCVPNLELLGYKEENWSPIPLLPFIPPKGCDLEIKELKKDEVVTLEYKPLNWIHPDFLNFIKYKLSFEYRENKEEGEHKTIYSNEFRVTEKKEKELKEMRLEDPIGGVEILVRENELDKSKADVFIKDLKTDQEEFFTTLSCIDRTNIDQRNFDAKFRNGHLYILRPGHIFGKTSQLWKHSFKEKGELLLEEELRLFRSFTVSPTDTFIAVTVQPPSMEEFVLFVNPVTKEQRVFDGIEELTKKEEVTSYLEEIEKETDPSWAAQYSLYIWLAKWSNQGEELWGFAELTSPADPPTPSLSYIFKINTNNWEVRKFGIDPVCFLGPEQLNPERESIIYERISVNGELVLVVYDLDSGEEKIITSYSKKVVDKYFTHVVPWYCYPTLGGEDRFLYPRWVDNTTIMYVDFETREEVIKKIE